MTNIEWTDETWNPIRGCSRVSAGCVNCYAERQAIRQIGGAYVGLIKRTSHGPAWTGEARFVPELLDAPLRWSKPRRVFVNSMSDLFHEQVPAESIDRIFAVMALCPQHTFQILTKRPERMREHFDPQVRRPDNCPRPTREQTISHAAARFVGERKEYLTRLQQWAYSEGRKWPLPNVHLGVSVEDQASADERIPLLLQTPAAVRFVSYEPALGPVRFDEHGLHGGPGQIDWLIVGGESGPGARPCDIAWIRSAIEQCKAAGVPCFVKQVGSQIRVPRTDAIQFAMLGSWTAEGPGAPFGMARPANRKGGDPQEWPEDVRVREFPR